MDHAKAMAERFNCAHLFDCIIPKPGHILDDQGWGWVRYTYVVTRLDRIPKRITNDTRTTESTHSHSQS